MKSFLKGQYQNGVVVSTFYNRNFTKLQRSFILYNKVCGLNPLWCIISLYVNQEEKNSPAAMHSSLFCLFSSFNPDLQGSNSLKHASRNVQSRVSFSFTMSCCAAFNTLCYIITSSLKSFCIHWRWFLYYPLLWCPLLFLLINSFPNTPSLLNTICLQ